MEKHQNKTHMKMDDGRGKGFVGESVSTEPVRQEEDDEY